MNANIVVAQAQGIAISLTDLLVTLLVAFLVGLWVVYVYRLTHRGLTYDRGFLVSLVMIGPIVSVVMLLIGSNLALSLGMVGALSIIRFRNVIKDSRDMVYLFWAIAVGLGCGTYNWTVAIIASAFIGAVLFLLYYFEFGKTRHYDCIFVLNGSGEYPDPGLLNLINQYAQDSNMRSLEVKDDGWEMVFELRFPSSGAEQRQELLQRVRQTGGVRQVSLLAPHLALPV